MGTGPKPREKSGLAVATVAALCSLAIFVSTASL